MGQRKTVEQKIESKKMELLKLQKEKRDRDRKADAHRKIKLGGLVIASGADQLDPDVLVAGLLQVVDTLEQRPDLKRQYKEQGFQYMEARKK